MRKSLNPVGMNLPVPPNVLIGRARETQAVQEMLRRPDVRLVTLTGPGGAGKTRLALEAALNLNGEFADGAWFVPLAAVRDPQWAPNAIAEALHIRETGGSPLMETLKQTLATRRQLLVLDNFEQILHAAPVIGELLGATRYTKFLVTSRAALRLFGEYEYPVPPLHARGHREKDLHNHPAVELFAERARAVQPLFQLSPTNAATILELARRLDFMPLAIELAAARTKIFSPEAILARLDNRFGLLTGGARNVPARQQTLRGALDWSYDLLQPQERALLARIGIFRGGATWDAVADVAQLSKTETLEIVTTLLDQSLLRLQEGPNTETRVVMLETIREYARDKLVSANELETTSARHFAYYFKYAAEAEPHLWERQGLRWLQTLDQEHDNLRAALEWGQEHTSANVMLELNCNLVRFWMLRNHFTEGAEYLVRALERNGNADPTLRGRALRYAGDLVWRKGDYARAEELYRASLQQFQALNDASGIHRAQMGLATVAWGNAERATAWNLFETALNEARRLDDGRSVGFCLNALGELARWENRYADARTLHQRNLDHHQALGDLRGIAIAQLNLGLTAVSQQDHARGADWLLASAHGFRELGERQNTPYVLQGLAEIAAAQGEYARSAHLLGAMETLCEALNFRLWGEDATRHAEQVARVRAALGEAEFETCWSEGRGISMEEVLGNEIL